MTYHATAAQIAIIIVLAIWELAWKGVALWRAAHRNQSPWFVAILVINSVGILPIIYLLLTAKQEEDAVDGSHLKTPVSKAEA